MTDSSRVLAAQIEVERRRAVLMETVRELQQRLQPRSLASEAWEKAKEKGADLAEEAVDAVKARPVAVGGAIAALTMFLARESIKDVAVKLYDAMTSSDEPKPPPAALETREKPVPKPTVRGRVRKSPAPARKTEKAT